MSIKISSEVWRRSRHKSGNLLVLLALADHADDRGVCWPGISLLAREARLSERHIRRCISLLIASGEVEALPNRAPGGGILYHIRLDQLGTDNLSSETLVSDNMTSASGAVDVAGRQNTSTYIRESSIKSSVEPSSMDLVGLITQPKNGF
jgi:hypothetical protein